MDDAPTVSTPSLPPLPEQIELPTQLIEQWLNVPSTSYVSLNLTRRDVDRLLFAFNKVLQSQDALQDCLVAWSNGKLDAANERMHASRRLTIEGQNEVRQLFTAIMISALQPRQHAAE